MNGLTLQRIQDAHDRIRKYVKKTPLILSKALSERCGGEIYLKLENHQHTNTFKFRGAINKMTELSPDESRAGVVTASSGNHAQGAALAAQTLGIRATIFVPRDVSPLKLENLEKYDVDIVRGGDFNEVEPRARAFGLERGLTYISPYNDYSIMAGQGTIALEIDEELKDFDSVVVPVGGGGLISGIAVGVKSLHPDREVLGVLTPGAATMRESLRAGKLVKVDEFETLAEAFLGGIEDDALTFDMVKEYVNEILLVQEESVANAMHLLWIEEKQVVEGAGATSSALIMEQGELFEGKRVVLIVSGGNIADSLFSEMIGKH
ncbi:MAG: threonine/serine dehydratase [Candidatus Thorarchaeota archaeon]|nr:threonine/serine dehydratase [Candidatus Thorarchaeota archaeon]